MVRKLTIALAITFLTFVLLQSPRPVQSQTVEPVLSFVLLAQNDVQQMAAVKTYVSQSEGRITHSFQGQAFVAKLPATLIPALKGRAEVAAVFTEAVFPATLANYGAEVGRWAVVWNNLVAPPPPNPDDLAKLEAHSLEEQEHAFVAPDLPPIDALNMAEGSALTPGYYQTSEYMAGTVAVGIVLVESNGMGDPSTENWTEEEKQTTFNEIVAGLNWWAELEPRANLSFVYDDHFSNPLPTSVEPISRSYFDQKYWIADAMNGLGHYSSSYFTQVRDYNNAIRNTYQTDWAFTIFVVDSAADGDNRFTDGLFAYAYLGGPFMVMTSGNNGYGPGNMDAVTAHEVGHIFHAYDQYASAGQSCTQRTGYLDVENQNSQYGGCLTNETSIMRGQIYPYQAKAIDDYAAGQIGWRDLDGDNILDPLDTPLALAISNFVQTNNAITAVGTTSLTPYPSPSRTSVTINRLTGVYYRFNGGAWQPAQADDGLFNETAETYNFSVNNILPGIYDLEVTARDSAGNVVQNSVHQTFFVLDDIDGGLNTQFYPVEGIISTSATASLQGVAYDLGDIPLTKIEYRFEGGPWQAVQSQDGAIDSDYEPFAIPLDTQELEPGAYLVEARATNQNGYVEINGAQQEITVSSQTIYTIALPIVFKQ